MKQICVKHIANNVVIGVRYIPKDVFCHILALTERAEHAAVVAQEFYDEPISLPYLDQTLGSYSGCVTPLTSPLYDDDILVEETEIEWYLNQFAKIPRQNDDQWLVTTVGEWSIQRRATPPDGIKDMNDLHHAQLNAIYEVDTLPLNAMLNGLFFGLSSGAKAFIDQGVTLYDSAVPSHSSMLLDMAAASTEVYTREKADRLIRAADYSQVDDVYLVCQVGHIRIKHPEGDVVMVLCAENYNERMRLGSYADATINPLRNKTHTTTQMLVRNSLTGLSSTLTIKHPSLNHKLELRTHDTVYPERHVKPLKLTVFP